MSLYTVLDNSLKTKTKDLINVAGKHNGILNGMRQNFHSRWIVFKFQSSNNQKCFTNHIYDNHMCKGMKLEKEYMVAVLI